MARKTADANDSRERMIEAAISLMRGSGLSGAGINEVVRESGAPKGSVYHFFPEGKLSLAAEALAVYTQRVCGFIDAALSSRNAPEEKVRALFAAFARRVEEAGYLTQEKTFVDRKPRTYLQLTAEGRQAFRDHVAALRELLGS